MYQEIGDFLIRDWQLEDAPSVARYANNRKIWLNLRDGFPNPYSLGDAKSFLVRACELSPRTIFAIATSTEAIGSIGLMPGKDVHRFTAEMGYWLGEPYWGQGIMTRAVKALTDYAAQDLRLHRVYAEPYSTNPASAMVLEKAGFIREGILHSNAFKDGKILDQVLYSHVLIESTHPA